MNEFKLFLFSKTKMWQRSRGNCITGSPSPKPEKDTKKGRAAFCKSSNVDPSVQDRRPHPPSPGKLIFIGRAVANTSPIISDDFIINIQNPNSSFRMIPLMRKASVLSNVVTCAYSHPANMPAATFAHYERGKASVISISKFTSWGESA